MRPVALCLAMLPTALWAEDFTLPAPVSQVTLYPQGASITRDIAFTIPDGQHRLILGDLPRSVPLQNIRVQIDGAQLQGVTGRVDHVPPRDAGKTAAIEQAREQVRQLETQLRQAHGDIESIRLRAQAARARVGFLEALGQGDAIAQHDIDTLRALAMMVSQETLGALREAHDASREADEASQGLKDLTRALDRAKQALAALEIEDRDRAMLAIELAADGPAEGTATVTYFTWDAGWTPVYDLHLNRESGALRIARGAFIQQSTGETWSDVTVALSTSRPAEQTTPSDLSPLPRRIDKPMQIQPKTMLREHAPMADLQSGAMAMAPAAQFDGISVTYDYPAPVTLATGADRMRLNMGEITAPTRVTARAVPELDPTAFVMATLKNDTDEPVLPTPEASFYMDGRYIGQRPLAMIPAGAEADLSFGPIDGLRVSYVLLDRNQGDRGLISRSNTREEAARIEVQNLTGDPWPLQVIGRVPYSEQEDLKITWSATPHPSAENIDDARGILAWDLDLPSGAQQQIEIKQSLQWPDGYVLH